jgi:hypothetical protein
VIGLGGEFFEEVVIEDGVVEELEPGIEDFGFTNHEDFGVWWELLIEEGDIAACDEFSSGVEVHETGVKTSERCDAEADIPCGCDGAGDNQESFPRAVWAEEPEGGGGDTEEGDSGDPEAIDAMCEGPPGEENPCGDCEEWAELRFSLPEEWCGGDGESKQEGAGPGVSECGIEEVLGDPGECMFGGTVCGFPAGVEWGVPVGAAEDGPGEGVDGVSGVVPISKEPGADGEEDSDGEGGSGGDWACVLIAVVVEWCGAELAESE